VAPFVSINFSSYEYIKQKVGNAYGGNMPFYLGPLCGGFAGLIAMTCTCSFLSPSNFNTDLIKFLKYLQVHIPLMCCDEGWCCRAWEDKRGSIIPYWTQSRKSILM